MCDGYMCLTFNICSTYISLYHNLLPALLNGFLAKNVVRPRACKVLYVK